jgi:hypothetical protein
MIIQLLLIPILVKFHCRFIQSWIQSKLIFIVEAEAAAYHQLSPSAKGDG